VLPEDVSRNTGSIMIFGNISKFGKGNRATSFLTKLTNYGPGIVCIISCTGYSRVGDFDIFLGY
jgi:hypothetical protein